jgi:regulator of cell morphogenesis and NO signaling
MPAATALPLLEITLGDFVVAHPALARVFDRLGLDYCCGGKQTLAAACTRRGLDPATVAAMLDGALAALDTTSAGPDPSTLSLTALADHIETTHHAYVRAELPRLVELAERVARKHAGRDPRLADVLHTTIMLADEMTSHMAKEELVLFPFVRQLDAGTAEGGFHRGSIADPIRQMEAEHETAGGMLAQLRELTDGFTPDAESCNSHRALLAGLAEFEADLHRHVHKENNILFPRAVARTAQA